MAERVLVTGATGFIGGHLLAKLTSLPSVAVSGVVRAKPESANFELIALGEINCDIDWSWVLKGQRVVVHTAARAHVMDETAADPLTEFRCVNVEGTLNLARQAVECGVERFIFISSIGVNGNNNRRPFTEDDRPNPTGAGSQSKWEAELSLCAISCQTGMEIVIVRSPLVYGPNAPGNFGSLIRIIEKGVPLPLGAIHNKRSLIAMDNLVGLIITCIDHPAAANHVFLAGDGKDLSTSELLRRVGAAMGNPARLLPVPAGLLQFGATILGKKAMAQRLLGSLQVDISKAREVLGWEPPISVDEGLRRCFRNNQDG